MQSQGKFCHTVPETRTEIHQKFFINLFIFRLYIYIERSNLNPIIKNTNSYNIFKNSICGKDYRNSKNIKFVTQLRLSLSYLREGKFKRVLINPPTIDQPTTDQPTTKHLPPVTLTHQPRTH